MANILAPFGFSPEGTLGGAGPNFRLSERKIISSNGTAIYSGDAVVSVNTGYIQQATAGSVQIAGIFWGCKYLSVSQGRKVWSRYWPGSDANGDVSAYVIDNPDATFLVQSTQANPIAFASLNANVQLSVGTGNTLTGQSGMGITTPASTSTLPFIITGFVTDPSGANGTDITTAFNYVLVGFNSEIFHTGQTSIS